MLLTSCGFHLRGAVTLPPQMERTQLIDIEPRSALAEEITAALQGAGARVVTGGATALLVITDEREARRLLSVGTTGRASEYAISYQFNFELRAPLAEDEAEGEAVVLVPLQTISLTRDYVFDPHNVLGTGEEESLLIHELRTFAVHQMLLRLRAGLQANESKP